MLYEGKNVMQLDTTTEFGARVERRLREEAIAWLTTVRGDSTPQPSPIWFLWDGATFLIYSQPDTQKLRNIAEHPTVALNLNSDASGGDIVIITGEAAIVDDEPPANQAAAYLEKYSSRIIDIGMTADRFAQSYSVAIRVTPKRLRGF
jgi:PPOX class probable F420-dependent enzyme